MKNKLATIASGWIVLLLSLTPSYAQAPSSLAGDCFIFDVTSGAYPLASDGLNLFIPANSGNTYQVIGISDGQNSSGTYTYTLTGPATAIINFSEPGLLGTISASFATTNSGSFHTTLNSFPGAYQNADFVFSTINAPSSVAGKTVLCDSSSFWYFAPSGNTYTTSDGTFGTYSYSLANRSTGKLQINDNVNGAYTTYLAFETSFTGGYASTASSWWEAGLFTVVDTTLPALAVTAPAINQRWSNSVFTVTGTASDDRQVSAVYYQIFGQGWSLATTSNGWTNWTGGIVLATPGTNIIQAYSQDLSGNMSVIASRQIVYVLTAPMTVRINGAGTVSPNYNGQMLEIGKNYSMTATAGTGFTFGGWTGSVATNAATVSFIMQSNMVLAANFVDGQKPVLSITNLVAGQRWSNAVFTAKGTASDNWLVGSVKYQLNGGNWAVATGTTNWSAPLTLLPGTNLVAVYATDSTGNNSTTNSVSFQYVVTNLLGLQVTGLGTISPNYSNAWLEIGRNYSMTATPATGFRFTNWTGSLSTSAATLNFTMASNLSFTANFVDTNRPVLSLTNVVDGQRWSNAVFTMRGTAADNGQVSAVSYQLNGSPWSNAVTANAWTNWAAALNLVPGTNAIQAYARDATGNVSPTNRVILVFVVTNQLRLRTTGLGTIAPNYSNVWLEIGRNYSITSAPASGFAFTNWLVSTNWIGGVPVAGTRWQFKMQSNLTVQANFLDVTKPAVAFTAPTAGQRLTNALVTVKGTVLDNWQISNVWYQLNSGAWNAGTTTNGYTNWTSPRLTLGAGTNSIKAYALDWGGNFSLTNSVSFVSSNTFLLQLAFTNAQPLKTNGLIFSLNLSTGLNGQIQYSTNLTSWAPLTNFIGTNTTLNFRDPAATNASRRFYRAVVP